MLTIMLLTAGLCLALIPLARKIGLVDIPGGRKVHQEVTPLTGGPALAITVDWRPGPGYHFCRCTDAVHDRRALFAGAGDGQRIDVPGGPGR
jgi:hypothetical protein